MVQEKLKHPLETLFNLAPEETSYPLTEKDEYETVPAESVAQTYKDDDEDKDINEKIETIYEAAMSTFEQQTAYAEMTEPRYAARNAEVAAIYLNHALSAVSLKAKVKNEKRKQSTFIPYGNNTNISGSQVVVANRNDILEMMMKKELENS